MLRNILIMSDFSKQRELRKIYKINRSKVVPFNRKEKRSKPMQGESNNKKTKIRR